MSHEHPDHGDRPARIPAARRPQREIGIRELRNAGKVVADLAGAGAVGRVTSGGRLVGCLVPATPAEQRADELAVTSALSRAEVLRTIRRNNHRETGELIDPTALAEELAEASCALTARRRPVSEQAAQQVISGASGSVQTMRSVALHRR